MRGLCYLFFTLPALLSCVENDCAACQPRQPRQARRLDVIDFRTVPRVAPFVRACSRQSRRQRRANCASARRRLTHCCKCEWLMHTQDFRSFGGNTFRRIHFEPGAIAVFCPIGDFCNDCKCVKTILGIASLHVRLITERVQANDLRVAFSGN